MNQQIQPLELIKERELAKMFNITQPTFIAWRKEQRFKGLEVIKISCRNFYNKPLAINILNEYIKKCTEKIRK
jgi:hypothetical protein